jgi:hypothetical protein
VTAEYVPTDAQSDAREELFGVMDAANIDLKGFYGGLLQDPLHSCAAAGPRNARICQA